MEEIWKNIKDYPDYEVSNLGRVKSLKFGKQRILRQCIDSSNYYIVLLYNNRKSRTFKVHQLVAIGFLNHKLCGHKLVINHKDFNKLNNHVDNLEIVTQRENANFRHIKHSSQYTGVFWNKEKNKWQSSIYFNGKLIFLGRFSNEYDAHITYQNKLKNLI